MFVIMSKYIYCEGKCEFFKCSRLFLQRGLNKNLRSLTNAIHALKVVF